jgi:hypothetical protein
VSILSNIEFNVGGLGCRGELYSVNTFLVSLSRCGHDNLTQRVHRGIVSMTNKERTVDIYFEWHHRYRTGVHPFVVSDYEQVLNPKSLDKFVRVCGGTVAQPDVVCVQMVINSINRLVSELNDNPDFAPMLSDYSLYSNIEHLNMLRITLMKAKVIDSKTAFLKNIRRSTFVFPNYVVRNSPLTFYPLSVVDVIPLSRDTTCYWSAKALSLVNAEPLPSKNQIASSDLQRLLRATELHGKLLSYPQVRTALSDRLLGLLKLLFSNTELKLSRQYFIDDDGRKSRPRVLVFPTHGEIEDAVCRYQKISG